MDYCDGELIRKLIDTKDVFNHIETKILNDARSRANPIEEVKVGFFRNRAAIKLANLDKILGWCISREYDAEKRLKNNLLAEDYNTNVEDLSQNCNKGRFFFIFRIY